MALMSCYACDTRFDRFTRRCPKCGTYVLIERTIPKPEPVAAPLPQETIEPTQDTEPFRIVKPAPPPIPFRRRKPITPLLLIALIAAGVGIFVVSTRPTFSARDEDPTPTRSSLRSAVLPTSPPNPTTPLPPTPSPSPSPSPTATPTAQPPTATATTPPTPSPTVPPPSPTSRPFVSTDDIVVNGGFEDGDHAWYLEEGARPAGINAHEGQRALILAAGGAYADQAITLVSGGTYRLTAWARVGAEGDYGEIGLRFLDQDGQTIEEHETPHLHFTETTYARLDLLFTVPADVTGAKVIIWKPAGAGILAVDAVSLRGINPSSEPMPSPGAS
jgi:hypothetical protein